MAPTEGRTVAGTSDRIAHLVLIALCKKASIECDAIELISKFEETINNRKRKAAADEMLVCSQCADIYLETDNSDTACHFHSGTMQPDYEGEFWADHDENIFGEIDSDESRKEYPEGFVWNCCKRQGDTEEACQTSRHVPVPGQKRIRLDDEEKENVRPSEDLGLPFM